MPENTKDTVALYFLKALKQEGIKHLFLVPGYSIDLFVENCAWAGIEAIVAAHEGGAAYMADGYARARQGFGVCMGLAGPGVTNMVTAISAAYADRSPVLVVTGALPAEWDGDGTFQDSNSTGIDDCEIMRPITVWAQRIPAVYKQMSKEEQARFSPPLFCPQMPEKENAPFCPAHHKVGDFLQKAIRAMHGVENRPAFLSIPLEVLEGTYDASYQPLGIQGPARAIDTEAMQKVPEILSGATRVAILAGNGCVRSNAGEAIKKFAEDFSIPVVTTLRAKGLLSEEHPLSFGFFGIGGTLQANRIIMGKKGDADSPQAEVLLVLGATLNENNTYGWNERFPPSQHLVRVDVNPNSVEGKNYQETFIAGDVRTFLNWLRDHESLFRGALCRTQPERQDWLQNIRQTPYYDHEETRKSDEVPIHPARVVVELRKSAPRDSVLVVDSGAHSYHVPHHWESYAANELLMLTNTGPMGYGIALAIGAKLARLSQPCVAIVGDGSLLMHGMEIHTAVRHCIPLIVVVINNSAYGNVYLRATKRGEEWDKKAIELTKITPTLNCVEFARSLGADGILVEHPDTLEQAFIRAFEESESTQKPFVMDIRCCKDCPVPNNPYDPTKDEQSKLSASMDLSTKLRLLRYR